MVNMKIIISHYMPENGQEETGKKVLAVICSLVIFASMAGCGAGKNAAEQTQGLSKTETTETTELTQVTETTELTRVTETTETALEPASEEITEIINTQVEETEYQREDEREKQYIYLNSDWQYAGNSAINSGYAVLYKAGGDRKNIIIGVNAGHGTSGGSSVKTLCHPDGSAKTTGGSTAAGATMATAVSGGMTFRDGTLESQVTLRMAQILRDRLLEQGYDVLMIRDDEDVQLDNVARTVICNNVANCHISLHWDGDGLSYDKGCFYISVPDALKDMEPVASHWQQHDALGVSLITGLSDAGAKINGNGSMAIDLTQTSYSTVPSVDIELGNACSDYSDTTLIMLADGLVAGINAFFPDNGN